MGLGLASMRAHPKHTPRLAADRADGAKPSTSPFESSPDQAVATEQPINNVVVTAPSPVPDLIGRFDR
jgi:hypothetical protein